MAGQTLVADRYRLTSQIGSGGMGRVWLARDETLHRDVAVKEVVLPDDLTEAERDDLRERTLREARAAGRLNHPNVVQVYDVVPFGGRPWIVMEYVKSRSLYQVIKEDGPVSPRRAAEIGLAVLAALRAAHAAGVWHRDVKPGNVLLADDGRVVLTDFGLATFDGDGAATRSGLILGSAQYISPERARDGVSGPESDMWSLGATLYAAVEGRSPYARDSSMATLTALATMPPDEPRRAGPLRGLLIGLLRKNPRQRLTASQVEKELRRVLAGDVKPRGRLLVGRQRTGPDAAGGNPGRAGAAGPDQVGGAESGGGGSTMTGRERRYLQTATEETRRVAAPARRWPWVLAAAAVIAALPVTALAVDRFGHPTAGLGPSSAPTTRATAPSPTPELTSAMQTQACLNAPANLGVAVSGPTQVRNQGTLPDWLFQIEPAAGGRPAYHVAVPDYWRTWTIAEMRCFRDPTSAVAATVIPFGARPEASLSEAITSALPGWLAAAHIADYNQLSLSDVATPEGAARLDYEYVDTYAGVAQKMHGVVWLTRRHGQVYLVGWLSPAARWTLDKEIATPYIFTFDVDG